ncbi:MAG: glycoside hydrolase family 97 N-terminal domain-containing protein, partial [Cyclobacteriaceae bacterium]|nr:glycoside hydrolase family 97 N-terminal domain-containing protein [Cyclobacteriaceae bacterium]
MKHVSTIVLFVVLFSFASFAANPDSFTLVSPDGKLSAKIELKDKIYYSLAIGERQIINPSPISMELSDGTVWGKDPIARKNKSRNVNENLTPLYGKRKVINDHFNELTITFKGNYTIIARLYNEGFAYRFGYPKKGEIIVKDEEVKFNFAGDFKIWAAHNRTGSFEHSYEDFYQQKNISQFPDSMAMLPILVQTDFNVSVAITESDLED